MLCLVEDAGVLDSMYTIPSPPPSGGAVYFVFVPIFVYGLCDNRTEEACIRLHQGEKRTYHHITSLVRHSVSGIVLVCCLVVHCCMVVWVTGIQYLHMYSQLGVVFSLYGPARHSMMQCVSIEI